MRCFIQDLSLNLYSYLDPFLHGSSSSFDNHWRYQQLYHKLLGKLFDFERFLGKSEEFNNQEMKENRAFLSPKKQKEADRPCLKLS